LRKTPVFDEILPGSALPDLPAPKPDARKAPTRPAKARGHCQKPPGDATLDIVDFAGFPELFRKLSSKLARWHSRSMSIVLRMMGLADY
jgi:hypothetical protein